MCGTARCSQLSLFGGGLDRLRRATAKTKSMWISVDKTLEAKKHRVEWSQQVNTSVWCGKSSKYMKQCTEHVKKDEGGAKMRQNSIME